MRDLDNRDLVTGDFLVVSGDVVSNINLESALARHKARREKDKNAIMTLVLRQADVNQRLKRKRRRPVFVIEPRAERCLHYEEIGAKTGRHLLLDSDFLTSHGEIEVRQDLIDPYIDICTPDVLAQWSENFDYQSLRRSFLFGVLKDYELNGKTIHTHVVKHQYAQRVKNLRAYDTISREVLGRWMYPLCPDCNLVDGQTFRLKKGRIYQEDSVTIGRNTDIKGRTTLAAGTQIGENSSIIDSVIGRGCRIGREVHIRDAYLWDGVIVKDHAKIVGPSVIANNVTVGEMTTIQAGALISFGSHISDRSTIPPVKISKDEGGHQALGTFEYDSDASSDASISLLYHSPSASSSTSSISTFATSESGFEDLDTSRRSSFHSVPSDDVAQNRDFQLEATGSILDGLSKGDAADTIFLELNGYRMSVDASQHEVRQALVAAFVKRISSLIESVSPREAVKQIFTDYKGLVERIILDKATDEKADQVDFLLLIQKDLIGRPSGDQLLLFIAKEMYDQDIVEEDGILQWWEDPASSEGEMGKMRCLSAQLITFLREAEEDDESEEDEEEEDGE